MFFSFSKKNCGKLYKVIFAMTLLMSIQAYSQTDELGSWNIISLKKTYSNRFYSYAETQTRSQKIFNNFYYYELKGGGGYNFTKDFNAFMGLGKYETYAYDGNFRTPVQADEFRMWEQFALVSRINRVLIEHRYRIEQRWINGDYRNRFRVRLNAIVPINHTKIISHTWYASIYDELFLTNEAPYFERNRFLAGGGYQFNDKIALQTCWIRQFDYRNTLPSIAKNFMQTTLFITLPAKKKVVVEKHPSSDD
jgi:hypothetical protein